MTLFWLRVLILLLYEVFCIRSWDSVLNSAILNVFRVIIDIKPPKIILLWTKEIVEIGGK